VTVIRGGTVYLEEGPRRADVLVVGEAIAGIGAVAGGDADVIDATGCAVLPGFIDIHVHADDAIGGIDLADTFLTASEAAVLWGLTTICGFVTQGRGRTLEQALEASLERARRGSYCDYTFHITPAEFGEKDWEAIARLAAGGYRTLKLYTTYREAGLLTPWDEMEWIAARCAALGVGLLVHCEDQDILDAAGGARPPDAEIAAIEKVAGIAARTGARMHVVHVSTARGAGIVARTAGALTCETCPQYLLLDESRLQGPDGHRWHCTPPLRSAAEREAMVELAQRGAFEVIATDHCAFTRVDKDRHAPSGLAGIGALVPASWAVLGRLEDLALRLSTNPARVSGLYPAKGAIRAGSDADLVVLRTDGPKQAVQSSIADAYETFPGMTTTLSVETVLLRGEAIVRGARIAGGPRGRCAAGRGA